MARYAWLTSSICSCETYSLDFSQRSYYTSQIQLGESAGKTINQWISRYRKRVWKNLEKSGDVCAGAPFGHRSLRSPPSLVRWGCSCSSCGPARIDCRTPYNKGLRLRSRINLLSSAWRQAPLQQLMRSALENRHRLRSLDKLLLAGASSTQRSC
jgi:hypothetical protein